MTVKKEVVLLDVRQAIAHDADAKIKTVDQLIQAGIPVDDVSGVLELRETMTIYDFMLPKKDQIRAQPSVQVMIAAYKSVGGDIAILEEVIEHALEQVVGKDNAKPRDLNASIFSSLKWFRRGRLEEDLEEDAESF